MARLEAALLTVKMFITNRIGLGRAANPFSMPDEVKATPEEPLTLVKVLHMVAQ